jgi:hypothetical protein
LANGNIFPLAAKKNVNTHFPFQFNHLRMKIGARVSCVMCVLKTGGGATRICETSYGVAWIMNAQFT